MIQRAISQFNLDRIALNAVSTVACGVRRILRFLAAFVAAIWLGALVFGTFAALPLLFTEQVSPRLIPRYHTGMIAQLLLHRYFLLNLFCAVAMVSIAGLDRWYTGRIE